MGDENEVLKLVMNVLSVIFVGVATCSQNASEFLKNKIMLRDYLKKIASLVAKS